MTNMALSIHTNYSALITNTALNKSNNALATNQQRLGTGLRINSAADDAAGLQIATRLNAQSRGMAVAMRNVGDAVSMLQTAEGAFNEMTDIVQRMKDLATQAANGTNGADDLTALQAEFKELGEEVGNILGNTKYAGKALLEGGTLAGAVKFQIGASSTEVMDFDASDELESLTKTTDGALQEGMAMLLTDVSSDTAGPQGALIKLENALNDIGTVRAKLGANINRLNHT